MATKAKTAQPVPTIKVMPTSNWVAKHIKPNALQRNPANYSRTAWLLHIQGFNGKPVASWVNAVSATQPRTIKAGSKTVYTPKQWLTWFVKAGVVTITNA